MNKKQEVLDCALSRLRKYGYNGCSFREIATELDIKHTSIHYYFPTKDTLVKEVIENYSTDFFKNLDHSSLDDYFQIFLEVAEKNELCLCSVLTHDKGLLTPEIIELLEKFKNDNIDYIKDVLEKSGKTGEEALMLSETLFSSLEGALGLGNLSDYTLIQRVVTYWKSSLIF